MRIKTTLLSKIISDFFIVLESPISHYLKLVKRVNCANSHL